MVQKTHDAPVGGAIGLLLLGEHVGWRRWVAVFAGFGGVLMILRPGAGTLSFAAVAVLFATAACAFRVHRIDRRRDCRLPDLGRGAGPLGRHRRTRHYRLGIVRRISRGRHGGVDALPARRYGKRQRPAGAAPRSFRRKLDSLLATRRLLLRRRRPRDQQSAPVSRRANWRPC